MRVYSVIVPCTIPFDELARMNPQALILSGGPWSVYDPASPTSDDRIFRLKVPILGSVTGCNSCPTRSEGGWSRQPARVRIRAARIAPPSDLLKGLTSPLRVWNSHGDHIGEVPPGFRITGRTENAVSVIESAARKMYAVEFHPEVHHTDQGEEILQHFVGRRSVPSPIGFPRSFIEETVERVGSKSATPGRSVLSPEGSTPRWRRPWSGAP